MPTGLPRVALKDPFLTLILAAPSLPHRPLFSRLAHNGSPHLSSSQPGSTLELFRSVPVPLWSSDKRRQAISLSQGCFGAAEMLWTPDSCFQAQPLPTSPPSPELVLSLQILL